MKTILVIEDESLIRELIAKTLEKNYRILLAEDGDLGLELAQKHLPDLIISDIAMQGLDGIALLQALRAEERTQTIPLLFLTACGDYPTIRQAMSLGADDYLLKPFEFADLQAAIQASLLKQSQRNARHESIVQQLCRNISISLPHELRTSVMVVQGYTHILLEEKARFEPETREMLENIQHYSNRLHKLTEKMYWYLMTEILQPDSVQIMADFESQQTIRVLSEDIARQQGRSSDLRLKLEATSLSCSEEFFQRIVLELVENAFKFSNPGDHVQISSRIEQQHYVLTIKDAGRGFSVDELEQINPFMQFGREKYEQQGTGLGLSIASRLVKLSGGELHIQSKPYQYTLVTVVLPSIYQKEA